MFDSDLIDSLEEPIRSRVRNGLGDIASSGIIEAQKLRLFTQVASKADSTEVEVIAGEIKAYRQNIRGYLSLQQLGDAINKEREDANEE